MIISREHKDTKMLDEDYEDYDSIRMRSTCTSSSHSDPPEPESEPEPAHSKLKVDNSSSSSQEQAYWLNTSASTTASTTSLQDNLSTRQQSWKSAFSNPSTSSSITRTLTNSRSNFNPSIISNIGMKRRLVQENVEKNRFQYMRALDGHGSCVNALAFSPGEGRYLASAGDDMQIHIRDVLADIDSGEARPLIALTGHRSNIFSLSFSCDGTNLFSGGNDDKVLHYDVSRTSLPSSPPPFIKNEPMSVQDFLGRPEKRIRSAPLTLFQIPRRSSISQTSITPYDDTVKEVSSHPTNSNLVLSCSDNGEISLTDIRTSDFETQKRQARASWSSCVFNPNKSDGNTFAGSIVSEINGSLCLYDLRSFFSSTTSISSFSSNVNSSKTINKSDSILEYSTVLQNYSFQEERGLLSTKAEILSLSWDSEGKILASNVSLFKPTLYSINDPFPLATLDTSSLTPHLGTSHPESIASDEGGYHSGCTVKHSSFGRWDNQLFYAAGSDDFRGYGWKIPEIEKLKEMREIHQWRHLISSQYDRDGGSEDVYYVHHGNGDTRLPLSSPSSSSSMKHLYSIRPTSISNPYFKLEGSKSITNSVLCHPNLPFIATGGTERLVRIYSCLPLGIGDKEEENSLFNWKNFISTRKRNRIRNRHAVARAMVESLEGVLHSDDDEDSDEELRMDEENHSLEEEEEEEEEEEQQQQQQNHSRSQDQEMDSRSNSSQEGKVMLTHYQHHLLSLIKSGHRVDEHVRSLFDELIREEEQRRLFDSDRGMDTESDEDEDEDEEDIGEDIGEDEDAENEEENEEGNEIGENEDGDVSMT